jgi:hypothetical protein
MLLQEASDLSRVAPYAPNEVPPSGRIARIARVAHALPIGIDFDNTLVVYDQVFLAQALRGKLLGAEFRGGKQAVRDAIRLLPQEQQLTTQAGPTHQPSGIGTLFCWAWARSRRAPSHTLSAGIADMGQGPAYDLR